jgi:hypothetical protein
MSLYFVYLRQPTDTSDPRNDPFWEFGSFGRTGCHSSNLLRSNNGPLRKGDRLAFLQGGKNEIRVVALTPPISLEQTSSILEVRWDKTYSPLPYEKAPLLVNNEGRTSFPNVMDILRNTNRSTFCGAAGSRFRGRTTPLDAGLANELMRWFESGNLPTASDYLHVIEASSGRWHKLARMAGWADIEKREDCFRRLGENSVASTPKEMTKRKSCATSRDKLEPILPSDVPRRRQCR